MYSPSSRIVGNLRFASWLELACLARSPGDQPSSAYVVVRLMDQHGRRQAWWGMTLNDRWLRGGVWRECYYGKQYRAFNLPQTVDESKTSAKYEDGVLSLVLPKKGNGSLKKIAIQ